MATNKDDVETLLAKHEISSDAYGKEGALSLEDLAREVSLGECLLKADEEGRLLRIVNLVEVSLVVNITGGRLVLVEDEHILADGTRRRFPQRKLHGKVRPNEAPADAAWRALTARLGLSAAAAELLKATSRVGVDDDAVAEAPACKVRQITENGAEAISRSYPGLRTRYVISRVEFNLPNLRENGTIGWIGWTPVTKDEDNLRELLSEFGLPSAHSFMTVEGKLGAGNGGRVHLWRWTMVEDKINYSEFGFGTRSSLESVRGADDDNEDEEESDAESEGEGTIGGIELAYKDLAATLRIIKGQKALLHERGGHMEMRLDAAEARVEKVLHRLGNIEDFVRTSTKQLFGDEKLDKKRMSRSLRKFISFEFTDGPPVDEDMRSKASSTMSPSGMSSEDPSKRAWDHTDDLEADVSETLSERLKGLVRDASTNFSNPEQIPGREAFIAEVEELRKAGGNGQWALDVLSLHERTGRRALLALAEAVVVPHSGELGTSDKTMRLFMAAIHGKYEEFENPFHNEAHAAVVCHSTHWLATRSKAWAGVSPQLRVATDIAALAHDVGHFGRNNAFCSNAEHELALTYNDRCVLESMHSSTCFQLMQGMGCNIIANSSRENRRTFREHVVGLILATDMTTHFDFLSKFRVRVATSGEKEFSPQENPDDRKLVSHACLKAADLGHAALPFEMHQRWALRLLAEFYEQGDEERHLGVPVSPMCERTGNVAEFRESQKGFLKFVIMPLFKELSTVTNTEVSETCLTRIEVNIEEWTNGEPHEELVKLIKEPRGGVKSTMSPSPKSKKNKKVLSAIRFESN